MKIYYAHPTSEINESAKVGAGSKIWRNSHIREEVLLGENVVIGESVYIGPFVQVGSNSKIQNGSQIFGPATIDSCVFIGPGVVITNDKVPRATDHEGRQKSGSDWQSFACRIEKGASIGAGVVCVSPFVLGEWCMIGAGSVVTHDVPAYSLFLGAPAKFIRWIGRTGKPLKEAPEGHFACGDTGDQFRLNHNGELEKL